MKRNHIYLILTVVVLFAILVNAQPTMVMKCNWEIHIEEFDLDLTKTPFIDRTYNSFTLPQKTDFSDIRFIKVEGELYCPNNQDGCKWYINDQLCISVPENAAGVFTFDCVNALKKGMNKVTSEIIANHNLKKLSVEMQVKPANC